MIIVTEDIGTCLCLSSVKLIFESQNIWRIDCIVSLSNDCLENQVNGNNKLQCDCFNVEVIWMFFCDKKYNPLFSIILA